MLKSLSSASKKELAEALLGRAHWRHGNRDPPEWECTPTGITPVKKAKVARAEPKKGLASKAKLPKQSYHCLLLCAMNCEEVFRLYVAYRSAPTRDEMDRKAVGKGHIFVRTAARIMANPAWKDCNGNVVSLPDDHENDPTAPLSLVSGLQGLDLVGTGTTLRDSLPTNEDGELDYRELEALVVVWLREIKAAHTVNISV